MQKYFKQVFQKENFVDIDEGKINEIRSTEFETPNFDTTT